MSEKKRGWFGRYLLAGEYREDAERRREADQSAELSDSTGGRRQSGPAALLEIVGLVVLLGGIVGGVIGFANDAPGLGALALLQGILGWAVLSTIAEISTDVRTIARAAEQVLNKAERQK